ncbi:hypothetical protein [Jeongeupia sp. USM3]|uniref:hypothetical protein n=1 Tax=Jeongeupia sp. USM3 TaxID=1906741 RepID=UPI0011AB5455|nr:hypothetical protein [Jeongeupia sp. USM3]
MNSPILIDLNDGSVEIESFRISSRLKLNELTAAFTVQPEQQVIVLGKSVLCQFASVQLVDNGLPVLLELRFERGALVSCFFTFPNAELSDEHHACSQWLTSKLGQTSGLACFPWGSAGVAMDRSGNSHVFLHNKNNCWAH